MTLLVFVHYVGLQKTRERPHNLNYISDNLERKGLLDS